jgi:hypothetical protein
MRTNLLLGFGVIASVAVANAAPPPGIALRRADTGAGLRDVASAETAEHVRIVGVDAKGKLIDYGEIGKQVTITDGRLTGLPAGKPTAWADLSMVEGSRAVVVAIDANRPAKQVRAALATLDKVCWGFAVAVGDKLGMAATQPCPAGPPDSPKSEAVNLSVVVAAKTVTFSLSRMYDVTTVARGSDDVGKTLAKYKQQPFFDGPGCAPVATDAHSEAGDGVGTAMPREEGKFGMKDTGRCDVLLAFDDSAKVGDVVDLFRAAMAAGFTAPHWVTTSQLPPTPPKPAPVKPDKRKDTPEYRAATVEVDKAQKTVDDARAVALATAKDTTKSVAEIQAAMAEVKRAEDALKLAKQKRKALLGPAK